MTPVLSILVPTLKCRTHLFDRLHQRLAPQMGGDVTLFRLLDDGEETIGAKRHRLLQSANTPYVAFVDDDDLVAEDYCPRIVSALSDTPDVIGFRLLQYDDGELSAKTVHSVSAKCWHSEFVDGELPRHFRTPNHLNPVRTEMAREIGYLDVNNGEDADYSKRLYERFPNMRETFIDADLYLYLRRTNRIGETCNPKP